MSGTAYNYINAYKLAGDVSHLFEQNRLGYGHPKHRIRNWYFDNLYSAAEQPDASEDATFPCESRWHETVLVVVVGAFAGKECCSITSLRFGPFAVASCAGMV
jgi:hypothetical protein